MNLKKMFEVQRKLRERIVKQHGLEGQDLLDKKILALQVELGELANEWRGFKFWSKDQQPRTAERLSVQGIESGEIYDSYEIKNPLLEEYVDCLHFILDIGLELRINVDDIHIEGDLTGNTPTETFSELFSYISGLRTFIYDVNLPATITDEDINEAYNDAFECFVGLGEKHLGFTWEQIEQAYLDKNKINHERQSNGY